jgi:hypothetical protein
VLLNEVASLSAQASLMHAEINPKEEKANRKNKRKGLQEVTWSSVKVENALDPSDHDANEDEQSEEFTGRNAFHRASSSGSFLKSLLDRWEEPVTITKGDATIEDVLRFRRALAFMDEVVSYCSGFISYYLSLSDIATHLFCCFGTVPFWRGLWCGINS